MDKIFTVNNCTSNPGLAIKTGSSTVVKFANTFFFKVNGRAMYIAAADAPALTTATRVLPYPNGTPVAVGSLAFDDGTVDASTASCRVYTLVATSAQTEAGTVTMSWLAGADFPKHRQALTSDFAQPNASNQVAVGWLYIKNESSALFVPGTTALDAAGITTVYTNNYAQSGQ